MALASLVAISGPKKVSIFRAHPFQWLSKLIFPHQNQYILRHINNRYINSYFNIVKQNLDDLVDRAAAECHPADVLPGHHAWSQLLLLGFR